MLASEHLRTWALRKEVSRCRHNKPGYQLNFEFQLVVSDVTFDLEQGSAFAVPEYAAVSRVDMVNREKGASGECCNLMGDMLLSALRSRCENGIVNADCDLQGSCAGE